MTRIRLNEDTKPSSALAVVRETCEVRGYHWEQTEPLTAVASEDGRPVRGVAVGVSQRLRVAVRLDESKHRLVLSQETLGAAYIAAGGPIIYVRLARRFGKLVTAVREDLAAATLL
ncbi:hypothetical protein CFN78_21030 [Amycolatopsis antarctica]|uniref:Uncharacterized protein n=1 Tax=Amycolatopsis antarctica TaxID=1854586 RepID=A0A263CYN7_9PSEU|nr:hypothetical protein [Amycolatopsis antarctica]OZM71280.1 hypothetical protein CFN78_21030 [Amycolatopsis antarctica]